MIAATNSLSCNKLSVRVAGRELVGNLSIEVHAGSFICVLGTNGVGKTLTLHTLAGLRPPWQGEININGDLLSQLPRRETAKRLGLLLQIHDDAFPLTVMDSVLMGRYPHASVWQWPNAEDREMVRQALCSLDLHHLEDRLITSLSGGERERVAIATILVQNPAIWLLDEPTNHLDPHHQLIVLDLLKQLTQEQRIVVTTVHNPALAMRYADQVLLLYGEGQWEFGPAKDLLEPSRLQRIYQTPFEYFQNKAGDRTVLLPA